ncbi:MAG: carbohydrate ABC transporter permease, partial [Ostreibacterium sp.]
EMFMVSIKPLSHLFQSPYQFFPEDFNFDSYSRMWTTVPLLGRYMINSVFISTMVTVIVLLLSIPAAYAFARIDFPYRYKILGVMLAVNMFSGAVLLIPLFRELRFLGLLNTYASMIVPGVAFLIPTSIWLMKSYLEKIPKDLEEAAWVDGANRFYIIFRIIIPMATPGIAVVSVSTFISAYAQQFLFAITFNNKTELMPIPQGLYQFFGRNDVLWNQLMAASLVAILPVLIVFLFMQRYIITGLVSGAVKG